MGFPDQERGLSMNFFDNGFSRGYDGAVWKKYSKGRPGREGRTSSGYKKFRERDQVPLLARRSMNIFSTHRFLAALLLAVAASLISCVAAELILRALKLPVSHVLPRIGPEQAKNMIFQKSEIPDLDYEPRPNAVKMSGKSRFSINSLGIRGEEIKLQKEPGWKRILVVGDSFTFGYGVSDEDTYVAMLGRMIKEHYPGSRVQTLNLGVSAYSAVQETAVVKYKAAKFQPDLLIIGYALNDPQTRTMDQLHDHFRKHAWWQHSNLLSALVTAREKLRVLVIAKGDGIRYLYQDPKEWASVCEEFREISAWSERAKVPALVVIIPYIADYQEPWPENYPYKQLHKMVADEAQKQGLEVLDLLPLLSAYRADRLTFSPVNIHFKPAGNGIIAAGILDCLSANYPQLFQN
jgi:lysophospholipase L1-like esterase